MEFEGYRFQSFNLFANTIHLIYSIPATKGKVIGFFRLKVNGCCGVSYLDLWCPSFVGALNIS